MKEAISMGKPPIILNHVDESGYIYFWLSNYIHKEAKYTRHMDTDVLDIEPDFFTTVMFLALDAIIEDYCLKELYAIFYLITEADKSYPNLMKKAIENIDNERSYSDEDKTRLKDLIKNTRPLIFTFIHLLVHKSNIFYDPEKKQVLAPKMFRFYQLEDDVDEDDEYEPLPF